MSLPLAIAAEKNERVLRSSNIDLYDGVAFRDFSVSASPNMNEVMSGIDQSIVELRDLATNIPIPLDSEILYSGQKVFNCFTISDERYLSETIEELSTHICVVSDSLTGLSTTDILVDVANTTLDCYSSLPLAPTQTDLNNALIVQSCSNRINIDDTAYNNSVKKVTDFTLVNRDVVISGGNITTSPTSFNVSLDDALEIIVDGQYLLLSFGEVILTANKDNYIYVTPLSLRSEVATVSVQSETIGAPAPIISGIYYKIEADGAGAVSVVDLRDSDIVVSSMIKDLSITTSKLGNLSVTGAKLEDVVVGATVGDTDVIKLTYDNKGRITESSSSIVTTSATNGDILQYNGGEWVNVPLGASALPSAVANQMTYYDGAVWQSSSAIINTGSFVGVGYLGAETPTLGLGLHNTATFGHQLQTPLSVASVGSFDASSSLAASTYYYVVIAKDELGETTISSESSAVIDGITDNQINVTWALVPNASGYRILRGTSTGVYTRQFTSNQQQFTDTGAAGVGVVAPVTNTTAYGTKISSKGVSVGAQDLNYPLSICVGNGNSNVDQAIISNCFGGITDKGNAGLAFRPSNAGNLSARMYSTFDTTASSSVRLTLGLGLNATKDLITLKDEKVMIGNLVAGNTPTATLQVIGGTSHNPFRVDSDTDSDILWAKQNGDVSMSVGDLRIETNAKGVVMKDRSSSLEYRIYIDTNGDVYTELV